MAGRKTGQHSRNARPRKGFICEASLSLRWGRFHGRALALSRGAEVLMLALESRGAVVVLEDTLARRVAETVGLPLIRSIGIAA